MENSESQIAYLKKILLLKDPTGKYDLYITNKRLAVISTSSYYPYGGFGLVGSLISEGITKVNESRKKEQMKNLTLDEMLDKDKKKSFALVYEDIEQIELHDPKSRWKTRKLEVKTAKTKTTFAPTREQFEQLSKILPSVAGLKGKLSRT